MHVLDADDQFGVSRSRGRHRRRAPTGVAGTCRTPTLVGRRSEPSYCHSPPCAALDVEQHVVQSVADLAGEQADRVDPGAVGDRPGGRRTLAPLRSAQLPCASRPNTQGRPASDSRSDHRPCRPMRHGNRQIAAATTTPKTLVQSQHLSAPDATTVDTDIEAAPVVQRCHNRRAPWYRAGPRDRPQRRSTVLAARMEAASTSFFIAIPLVKQDTRHQNPNPDQKYSGFRPLGCHPVATVRHNGLSAGCRLPKYLQPRLVAPQQRHSLTSHGDCTCSGRTPKPTNRAVMPCSQGTAVTSRMTSGTFSG